MIISSNSYLLIAWYTFLNSLGLYDLGVKRNICSSCGMIFTPTRLNKNYCSNCKNTSSVKTHQTHYSTFHQYRKELLKLSNIHLNKLSNEESNLYNYYISLVSKDQKYRTPNKKYIENIKKIFKKLSN